MNAQANRFLLSLIDVNAWDAAKWMATGFVVIVGSPIPPSLVIVFTHTGPAKQLFAGLRSKVGRDDEEELLRISIIEGTFLGNPNAYAVNVGPDVENVWNHFHVESADREERTPILSRVHRMSPNGPSRSLALFKDQYRKTRSYLLMPGSYDTSGLKTMDELAITKRAVGLRRKEDISRPGQPPFDPDVVVL